MCLIPLSTFKTFIWVKYILNIAIHFVYLIKNSFAFRLLDTKLMASTQPFKVFLKSELSSYSLKFSELLRRALEFWSIEMSFSNLTPPPKKEERKEQKRKKEIGKRLEINISKCE